MTNKQLLWLIAVMSLTIFALLLLFGCATRPQWHYSDEELWQIYQDTVEFK